MISFSINWCNQQQYDKIATFRAASSCHCSIYNYDKAVKRKKLSGTGLRWNGKFVVWSDRSGIKAKFIKDE